MSSFEHVALVTGGSSGIGFAIAEVLGEMGYGMTIAARRPEKLSAAANKLRERGFEINDCAVNLISEEAVKEVVASHHKHFGRRLDVLVNNAGVGVARPVEGVETKYLDMQLALNLRSIVLFYRECVEMLCTAGRKHRNALVVNLASIGGIIPMPGNSVYGATKAAVINFSKSMNEELSGDGVRSIALCPEWVDTAMTDFLKDRVPADQMMRPADIASAVRFALNLSPQCQVSEIVFRGPPASPLTKKLW